MSGQTKTKHLEILNSQTNAEENHNSKSGENLITREEIEDTPFWLIGTEENGYAAVLGKYRITEVFKTKTKVIEQLFNNELKWKTIVNVIGAMIQQAMPELTKDTNK